METQIHCATVPPTGGQPPWHKDQEHGHEHKEGHDEQEKKEDEKQEESKEQ